MARIDAMFKNPEKYSAELDSLKRCVSRATLSGWRNAIEGKKYVYLSKHMHVSPTHVREIVRFTDDEKDRKVWIDHCETEKLTLKDLHQELLAAKIATREKNYPAPVIHRSDAVKFIGTIKDRSVDLLLTDPPYSTDVEDIEVFAGWLPEALKKLKATGRAYVFIGAYPKEIAAYLSAAMPTQLLVWSYNNTLGPAPSKEYKLNWQAILYFQGENSEPLDCPVMNEQFAAREISAPDGRHGDGRWHAWEKPIGLAEAFIRHSTKETDSVLDPFCGTGTFALAAAKLGRLVMACEKDPEMLEISKKRGCDVKQLAA